MGGAVISLKSKKQTLIAQLSRESEFFVLTVAEYEAEWLSFFLRDIPLKELQGAIITYYDNQVTSALTANSLFNEKKQTIHLKHDYLNELICHEVI